MNVTQHLRGMVGLLGASLGVLAVAAGLGAPAERAAPAAAPSPAASALRDLLVASPFQFSRVKEGLARRDPFQIPLTKIEVVKGPDNRPVDSEGYKRLQETEADRLRQLETALAALKAAVAAGDGPTVLNAYGQVETLMAQSFVLPPNVAARDRLRGQFEALRPEAGKALVEAALVSARQKAEAIRAAFAAQQYQEVAKLAAEFGKLTALPEALDSPAWKALSGEVAALQRRAQAHLDFRSRPFAVSSIIVTRLGGMAVINGRSCEAGSRLDADTIVAKVESDLIVFVYKGEQIEYRIGSR